MSNDIVEINVSQQNAPAPSQLQQTGAIISQGGTTLAEGSYALVTQLADLTAILVAPLAVTSLAWASSVVTVTTAAPHGYTTSSVLSLTIAGATPTGYNGTFLCTITGASTFTYALTTNPGSETVPGTYVPAAAGLTVNAFTNYFAQNTNLPCYVLELGIGTAAQGVAALSTFLSASKQFFYQYLCPFTWAGVSAFATLAGQYTALSAKTYFYLDVTPSNYSTLENFKSVVCVCPAPGAPNTEVTAAAVFAITLATAPSSNNQVAPLAFRYVYGVTNWLAYQNMATLATLKAAFVNYIDTGAEGGISNLILKWGTTMDGKQWNYWYAADWAQINLGIALANAVINGSNNPLAPLYYNQNGINRLLATAQQTLLTGAAYGLFLNSSNNPITVTAQSFTSYVQQNPDDYAAGAYNGLSATVVPQTGFLSIQFNLQISDFVTG